MAWDKTLPTGNTKVNQSDNAIRDNWAWLEDAIKTEHTDPATIPSSPSSSVHLEGSSRVWVYTGATLLDSAADIETALAAHSSRFTAATAANTGMVVIDQNTTSDEGSLWVCTDGLTGAWKEITQKHAAVILASTLAVGGLLTASAGITIPTAQALDIPNESNVLTSSTDADQMNPFAHAARHVQGGADQIRGLVEQVLVPSAGTSTLPATWGDLVTQVYDATGRGGTSHALVFGAYRMTTDSTASNDEICEARLWDGSAQIGESALAETTTGVTVSGNTAGIRQTLTVFGYLSGVTAGSHTISLQGQKDKGGTLTYAGATLMIVDLGEESP